ncbi:polysaccharide deacetylase [Gemmatimonadetes bacterium T265]|nr:polysaccharide deacetylase [Gemmatimonadetes bacterium T265]
MTAPVPILMYHEVSPTPRPTFRKYVVSRRAFARQMSWLRAAGYTPVTLDALLAARTGGARPGAPPLPGRPVVITFDDGFHDCMQYAAEVLERHAFPATFFLVAGLVGGTSRWLVPERGLELRMGDWARARELLAAGFDCGSHSLTHPRLAALGADACRRELAESRRVLEDGLGREVRHLAYPYGSYDARVRDTAAEVGYRTACTVEPGPSTADDDLLALRRVPVNGAESLLAFIWRLRPGRGRGAGGTPSRVA